MKRKKESDGTDKAKERIFIKLSYKQTTLQVRQSNLKKNKIKASMESAGERNVWKDAEMSNELFKKE